MIKGYKFDWLGSLRKLGPSSVFMLVLFFGYFITGQKNLTDDVYWHIELGRIMVEDQKFPLVDDFSYTWNGREMTILPFVFEIIIYLFVDLLGYTLGTHLYMFFCLLATLVVARVFLKTVKAPLAVFSMVYVSIAVILSFRLLARPELISYLLVVIGFVFYRRGIESFTLRSYWPILLLLFFWSNYHSAMLGYVLFAGFYLDLFVRNLAQRADIQVWRTWLISGLGLLVVGFINPFYYHSLFSVFTGDSGWFKYIQEYNNIFFTHGTRITILPFVLAILLTLFLAVKHRAYGYLLILVIMTVSMIKMNRMITPALLMVIFMLADLLSRNKQYELKFGGWVSGTQKAFPLLMVVCMFYYYFSLYIQSDVERDNKPEEMIGYITEKGYEGNIFNEYGIGGFLIYHLYPKSRVHIDGRAGIFYDVPFFLEYSKILVEPSRLRDAIRQYDIQMAVVDNSIDTNGVIYKTGLMSLDFVDKFHSLYIKGDGAFRYAGWFRYDPACWADKYLIEVEKENKAAAEMAGLDLQFEEYLQNLVLYGQANDKRAFLRGLLEIPISNVTARFMAYQAVSQKDLEMARAYFSSLVKFQSRDYLAVSYALIQANEYQEAEELLHAAMSRSDLKVDNNDRIVMKQLIDVIRKEKGLTYLDEEKVIALEAYIEREMIDQGDNLLDYSRFCSTEFGN